MGILGKDLFDFQRPLTHTKVQFGRDAYWVEEQPEPQPYGATLVQLLNYDAEKYLHRVDALRAALKTKDYDRIMQSAPIGSRCLRGLSVSLPRLRAVGSPSRKAIQPCATS